MTYRVVYTQTLRHEVLARVRYFQSQDVDPETIQRWFDRLFDAMDELHEWPARYPVAEPETAERGIELRKMPFGEYLIFFRIDEQKKQVEVLSLTHGA